MFNLKVYFEKNHISYFNEIEFILKQYSFKLHLILKTQ